MITTEAQLQQALEQIQRLCRALNSLRVNIFSKNPKNFTIMEVSHAQRIILGTPEYHGSGSGVLKNAIDLMGSRKSRER